MEICKRENKSRYSCYIFDMDNKIVWKKGYDQNDDLYWQVVSYDNNPKSMIRVDINKLDDNYDLIDKLYNEIISSSKDNESCYYIDDINEYDNYSLYNRKDDFIYWVSDTGKINTEELYIVRNDESYSVIFKSHNPSVKNIKVVFSTNNSKYGNFSEAFRRDYGRTLDIAYDRYEECFDKIVSGNKQYLKKAGE